LESSLSFSLSLSLFCFSFSLTFSFSFSFSISFFFFLLSSFFYCLASYDSFQVTFSLAWIQRIESDKRAGMTRSTRRLLERAALRATELGLPHLHALTAFTMVDENMRGASGISSLSEAGGMYGEERESGNDVASEFLHVGREHLTRGSVFSSESGSGGRGGRGSGEVAVDLSSLMAIDDT
jgi:hypothetical protein